MSSQWYPFYPGDYARDTSLLTLQEHGAYLLLLNYYYATGGPLPCLEHCLRIAHAMLEDEQQAVKNIIDRFFDADDEGGFRNCRADREIENQQGKMLKAKEKAEKAALARWNKADAPSNAPSNQQAMLEQCQPQPQPQPDIKTLKPFAQNDDFELLSGDDPFSNFWKSYPRKVGKGAAQRAWKKIKCPVQTLALILKALEWQKESDQWQRNNGEYIPHPSTYLNQRRWEDEKPIDAVDKVFGGGE